MEKYGIVECEVTEDRIKVRRAEQSPMQQMQIPTEPWIPGKPVPAPPAEPLDMDIEIDNSAAMLEDQEVYSDPDLWGGGQDPVEEKNEREKALKARLKQKQREVG